MITRKHIIFYGYVQGVGFRWRARHAADLYGCTGWVHNKWNGTVEMENPGEDAAWFITDWRGGRRHHCDVLVPA